LCGVHCNAARISEAKALVFSFTEKDRIVAVAVDAMEKDVSFRLLSHHDYDS
jgi:hypothetical protein